MVLNSHVLELDSQSELLERLQLLAHFSSNLVTISGEKGAGKTWLAQRYLEVWAPEKNQALLMNFAAQDDSQRRVMLLSQLVSEPLFNPADSIAESFVHLMEGETCDIVIAIDDAHLLSDTFISELWVLVLEAQQNPLWTVNVLLFVQAKAVAKIDALLTRFSYGQAQKPISLEIEPFREQEADRFFEQLVIRFVEDDMEKRVRHAYRSVARRPGEIMALGDYSVEKRIIIRSIVGSPLNIALVVITLLALIGGGYWWLMSQPSPDDKASQITSTVEQTVIPTLPEKDDRDNIASEDDSHALPPSVTEEVSTVGDSDLQQQRVVINSEVVDALLEGRADSVDTSNIDKVVEDSIPKPEVEQAAEVVEPEVNKEIVQSVAKPSPQVSFTTEQLAQFSPRSYTLQLAAVTTLEEVKAFLEEYELTEKIYIYPTVRDDVDWYIVTYDNFPTIQTARDAVATLPQALQQADPWAKSLSQVQSEIEQGK